MWPRRASRPTCRKSQPASQWRSNLAACLKFVSFSVTAVSGGCNKFTPNLARATSNETNSWIGYSQSTHQDFGAQTFFLPRPMKVQLCSAASQWRSSLAACLKRVSCCRRLFGCMILNIFAYLGLELVLHAAYLGSKLFRTLPTSAFNCFAGSWVSRFSFILMWRAETNFSTGFWAVAGRQSR